MCLCNNAQKQGCNKRFKFCVPVSVHFFVFCRVRVNPVQEMKSANVSFSFS